MTKFFDNLVMIPFHQRRNVTRCKETVCDMYTQIVVNARLKDKDYYQRGCDPWMDFNQTICLTTLPDVDGFCGCLWNGRSHWPDAPRADVDVDFRSDPCFMNVLTNILITRFLLPDPEMLESSRFDSEYYQLSEVCLLNKCKWFQELADPSIVAAKELEGTNKVPGKCADLWLPVNILQCEVLHNLRPYNPCPWRLDLEAPDADLNETVYEEPVDPDELFCFSSRNCQPHLEDFACCGNAGIMKCRDGERMCNTPKECSGGNDYCCVSIEACELMDETFCKDIMSRENCIWDDTLGCIPRCEERQCSPMLAPWLAEWHGQEDPIVNGTATIVSDGDEVETKGPINLETIVNMEYFWVIAIVSSLVLLMCVAALLYLGLFRSLRGHDQTLNRSKTNLDLFRYKFFEKDFLPLRMRSLFGLPKGANLQKYKYAMPQNIIKCGAKMRRIAPSKMDFEPHEGPQNSLERKISYQLKKIDDRRAWLAAEDQRAQDELDAETHVQKIKKDANRLLEKTIVNHSDDGSLSAAADLYNITTAYATNISSTNIEDRKLIAEAQKQADYIIGSTDLPAEKLTVDPSTGRITLCPEGVIRMTGWLGPTGEDVYDGDSEQQLTPVVARRAVCKWFQTGECTAKRCQFLHEKARPGDRIREPVKMYKRSRMMQAGGKVKRDDLAG